MVFVGERKLFRYRGYYYDTETGLYYLNSRYYDPSIGRFVNADGLISPKVTVNNSNLFQFCGNNLINYIDINGTWAGSIGINLNATFIYGISITGSLVFDGKGNVGFQFSHAGTQIKNLSCGVADVGVGFTPAIIWDAQTIYDLEGNSTQLGASFGPAWYLGADAIWLDGTKSALSELSVVVGLGIGADIHVNRPWTNDTLTVFGGNQWGGRRPSGATGADMSTARWLAGSYVINDVDRINMGWVDDVYGMIKYLYDLF